MASSSMKVDCKKVEEVIKLIDSKNDSFTNTYKDIFNQFKVIDAAWNGTDNDSFNEAVMSFEKDFIKMTAYFESVVNHLDLVNRAYKTTENVSIKSAGKLSK